MVEQSGTGGEAENFDLGDNDEGSENDDWGDYGQEDEYDTGKMMADVKNELEQEKAIAENMA